MGWVLRTPLIMALVGLFLVAGHTARAATTTFGSTVFNEIGILNAGDSLGRLDGTGATITDGGTLTLQFDRALTGANLSLGTIATGGVSILAVSIGEVVGGVATFSGEFVLVDFGAGAPLAADLTAACSAIAVDGCSLLRIRNAGTLSGPGSILDGISGVTNAPEPASWALMITAFAGIGWRLKAERRAGPRAARAAQKGRGALPARFCQPVLI